MRETYLPFHEELVKVFIPHLDRSTLEQCKGISLHFCSLLTKFFNLETKT
jgi:hypothetical protein